VPYSGRMPRDTLTREQIVNAAIDLLDAEGLDGLNMRALGKRLGSAATAVYWHVGSKDNLIALAADQAWHEIALPGLTAAGWRAAATAMATGLHAMLTRHPWLVQAFGSQVLFGAGKARHDDHTLAIYEAAGFTGDQADQAAASVFTFVLGNALGPAAAASLTRKLSRDGGNADKLMRDSMAKASEIAAQFPRLRARLQTAASGYSAAPDNTFEFGLQAILDGLQAILDGLQAQLTASGQNAHATQPRPSTLGGPELAS
jgi:AcrR family transcriptional regulator